jgi:FKBP-type peptidyl-prolyl cis-trans isomerase
MVVTLASARLLAPPARAASPSVRRAVVAAAPSRARASRRVAGFGLARASRGRGDVSAPPLLAARRNPNEIEEVDIDAMGAPGDENSVDAAPFPPSSRDVPSENAPTPPSANPSSSSNENDEKKRRRVRKADSTDAVATFMTRRFGIAGGLAWLGVLTFGVVSEQLKTRREVREAKENTVEVKKSEIKVSTSVSGVRSSDLKIGGGEKVQPGYLVAADVVAKVVEVNPETGAVETELTTLVDTRKLGRQLVFSFGSKPQGPIVRGLLESVGEMRQGGRRLVVVPPSMAFGADGAALAGNVVVPPNATVQYDIELTRVSVPPS